MSNRDHIKQPDGSILKVYVPRSVRRERRNERRAKLGSPLEVKINLTQIPKEMRTMIQPKSYNKVTALVSPDTGEVMPDTLAPVANSGNTTFLLDGIKHTWNGLGGAEGFLTWARDHPTKFYELSFKLLPSQVTVHKDTEPVTIIHSLAPPNYNPHLPKPEPVKEVNVEAVLTALRSLDEDALNAILNQLK